MRSRLESLLLGYLPASAIADPDLKRRGLLLVGFCGALALTGPVFCVLAYFVYRLPLVALITAVATLLSALAPVVYRATGSLHWGTSFLHTALVGSVLLITGIHEGLTSPALAWLAVAPPLATMTSGRAAGMAWVIVAELGICVLLVLDGLGALPNRELAPEVGRIASAWNSALLVAVMFCCGILVELLRTRTMEALLETRQELENARQQSLLADRMSSLGTLAAGIAHEINNPLTYVSVNLDYVAQGLAQLRERREHEVDLDECERAVAEAAAGARRVKDIVRDLRTFVRGNPEGHGPVDARAVLEAALRMVETDVHHRARLDVELEDVPTFEGRESHLAQIFVNLLTNAIQALPDRPAAENRIGVRLRRDDPFVVVEFADNGVGIPPELRARIFDPFFTTKPVGLGTGLGLSICHNLVTEVGGTIELAGEAGVGTVFRVRIPVEAPPRA